VTGAVALEKAQEVERATSQEREGVAERGMAWVAKARVEVMSSLRDWRRVLGDILRTTCAMCSRPSKSMRLKEAS
jgi:hypothetical protein